MTTYKSTWARHKAKACTPKVVCPYCRREESPPVTRVLHPPLKNNPLKRMSRVQLKEALHHLQAILAKKHNDLARAEIEVANLKIKYEQGLVMPVTDINVVSKLMGEKK